MDFIKALNSAMGVEEKPSIEPKYKSALVKKSASVRREVQNESAAYTEALPSFDITTWVMPESLKQALALFKGSALVVNPFNGAVCFTFGR